MASIWSILSSSAFFAASTAFFSAFSLTFPLLLLPPLALDKKLHQKELQSRRIQGVDTTQDRLREEGSRGSHETDRDCSFLRLWLRQDTRCLSPWFVVRLVRPCLRSARTVGFPGM